MDKLPCLYPEWKAKLLFFLLKLYKSNKNPKLLEKKFFINLKITISHYPNNIKCIPFNIKFFLFLKNANNAKSVSWFLLNTFPKSTKLSLQNNSFFLHQTWKLFFLKNTGKSSLKTQSLTTESCVHTTLKSKKV